VTPDDGIEGMVKVCPNNILPETEKMNSKIFFITKMVLFKSKINNYLNTILIII
jgi:hypothetical protein